MEPDNTATSGYQELAQDSSLEAPAPQPVVAQIPDYERPKQGILSIRHRKKLLLINAGVLLALAIVGGVSYLLFAGGGQGPVSKSQKIANYKPTQLPVSNVRPDSLLQVGKADQLTINGKVNVGNTLVLVPSTAPSAPTAGQFYYNATTNTPYFYNGKQFVSLAQTIPTVPNLPANIVNTIGGRSGSVGLGTGLVMSGGQIGLQLQAGNGIAFSGSTITNTGVVSLSSGSANITITNNGNGNYSVASSTVGLISGGGTTNQIPLYTPNGQSLGDSILSQGSGTITDAGALVVQGAASADSLNVTNNISGGGSLSISGNGTISGTLGVTGNTSVGGALGVTGNTTLTGTLSVAGNALQVNGSGNITTSGTLSVSGGNFTVDGSGNAIVSGAVTTNTLQSPASTGLTINAGGNTGIVGSDNGSSTIIFYANGISYALPAPVSNFNPQTICTTQTGCASGLGAAVILGPVAAQIDNNSTGSSIWINNTTGANLLQLERNGVNKFVVSQGGSLTTAGDVTVQGSTGLTVGVANSVTGSLNLANSTSGFLGTLQVGSLDRGVTYNLPVPSGAGTSVDICLSTGNCASAGGGITGSGTTGHISKFSSGSTITDSGLTESGTTLTYAGNAVINAGTGFTGNLLNLEVNGSSKYSIDQTGASTQTGPLTVQGGGINVTGNSTITGTLTVGAVNGATLSGGTLSGGNFSGGSVSGGSLDASTVNGLLVNSGTITNPIITGAVTGTSSPNITGFGTYNGQTINTNSIFTGTVAIQGSNSLTLGMTGTATGSILFKGSTAASGTLTLIGQANPSNNTLTLPNETGTLCSTGSICSGYAAASPSGAYVQLQASTPGTVQTGNLNINGTAIVGTLNVSTGDLSTAGTLRLNNAGALSNITGYTQSSGNFDQSASSGTFKTGSGNVSLNGNTTVTGTNTFTVNNALTTLQGGLTASGGTISLTTGAGAALTLQGGTGGTSVDSGTGTVAIGTSANNKTINIGAVGSIGNTTAINIGTSTGAAQTIVIGSTGGSSSLTLQGGTGGLALTTQGGTLGIGNNAVAQNIAIGNSTGTTTVSVSCGTGSCNFGTNATDHSTTIGSTTGVSALTLQGGTGGVLVDAGTGTIAIGTSANAKIINVGTNNSANQSIVIGSTFGSSSIVLQAGSGGLTAAANLVVQGSNGITIGTSSVAGKLTLINGSSVNNVGTLQLAASIPQATTFTLPGIAGTGYNAATICVLYFDNSSNCTGAGGGVIASGATIGFIPKFSGPASIVNSGLSDSGTVLNYSGSGGISFNNQVTLYSPANNTLFFQGGSAQTLGITASSGTSQPGQMLQLQSGQGTGIAPGGDIAFRVSPQPSLNVNETLAPTTSGRPQNMAGDIGNAPAFIYWINHNSAIARSALDGSGINQAFVPSGTSKCPTSPANPTNTNGRCVTIATAGITVDTGFIYWSNNFGCIGQAQLNATPGATQTAGSPNPYFLCNNFTNGNQGTGNGDRAAQLTAIQAMVYSNGWLYWITGGTSNGAINPNCIGRAQVINGVYQTGTINPTWICSGVGGVTITGAQSLSVNGNFIYWGNAVSNNVNIGVVNISTSTFVGNITPAAAATGLAFDNGNNMYWTENSTNSIAKVTINPSTGLTMSGTLIDYPSALFNVSNGNGGPNGPLGITNVGSNIYWVNSLTGQIAKAFIGGTNPNDLKTVADITGSSGSAWFSASNNSSAFQVQNAGNASILNVDTSFGSNLLLNGDFELYDGLSHWASFNPNSSLTPLSPQADPSHAWQGSQSLSLTSANANDGVEYVYAFTPNTWYTLSMYVLAPNGSISDFSFGHQETSGGGEISCGTSTISATVWTRLTCTFQTGATISGSFIYAAVGVNGANSEQFNIDGVQLQLGNNAGSSTATPFNPGGGIQLNGAVSSPMLIQNKYDSTSVFQIQNSTGTFNLFDADTINDRIGIGTLTPGAKLDIEAGINGKSNIGLLVNQNTSTGTPDILDVQKSSSNVLSVSNNGSVLLQPSTDSNQAFIVKSRTGSIQVITVDTSAFTLAINGHIVTGNSSGNTTGAGQIGVCTVAGATPTIIGNDTAGLITYTTSSSGNCNGSPGALVRLNFANSFGAAPNVVIVPANDNATNIKYFVDQASISSSSFTIYANANALTNTTYKFYYHVFQ